MQNQPKSKGSMLARGPDPRREKLTWKRAARRSNTSQNMLISGACRRQLMVAAPPATPRHTGQPLPLLPSGPGGVRDLPLRGDRWGHPDELPCQV